MQLWRISNHADLSGLGGKYSAGRWNHLGRLIVYCADHPALAMLEILVHVDPEDLPSHYRLIRIEVPDDVAVEDVDLPADWQKDPYVTRQIFESFCAEDNSPALRVPSVILPDCHNVVLNPQHADMVKIRIVSVTDHPFDRRFLG